MSSAHWVRIVRPEDLAALRHTGPSIRTSRRHGFIETRRRNRRFRAVKPRTHTLPHGRAARARVATPDGPPSSRRGRQRLVSVPLYEVAVDSGAGAAAWQLPSDRGRAAREGLEVEAAAIALAEATPAADPCLVGIADNICRPGGIPRRLAPGHAPRTAPSLTPAVAAGLARPLPVIGPVAPFPAPRTALDSARSTAWRLPLGAAAKPRAGAALDLAGAATAGDADTNHGVSADPPSSARAPRSRHGRHSARPAGQQPHARLCRGYGAHGRDAVTIASRSRCRYPVHHFRGERWLVRGTRGSRCTMP